MIPGGTVNADKLRLDESAVQFVRDFVLSGKPVAAICHGPWALVEAEVVKDRTLTSYPSLRTDLRNAGATVVDQAVCIDGNLITSRSPKDLMRSARRSRISSRTPLLTPGSGYAGRGLPVSCRWCGSRPRDKAVHRV